MKFTVLVRSKRIRFAKHIKARTLISSVVLASLLVLISSRSTDSIDETLTRINVIKTGLIAEQQRVNQVHTQTSDELRVLKSQLASMEARLREIDVLSQHVAEQSGIDYPSIVEKDTKTDSQIQNDPQLLADHPLTLAIEDLDGKLQDKVKQLQALESVMMGHHIQDISEVAGRPIQKGWLSSYYGVRKDPFTGKPTMHKGLDFAGKEGDPVVATAAGLVTWAGERYGYGNLIEIDHGNGLVSRYGHNASLKVKIGDVVTKGQVVANMGSTGRSTGAHVHYEVLRKGKQIDPLPFVY
jgi:murein DD-endopeptidase MepM/ murein hydrolase activator NlpD